MASSAFDFLGELGANGSGPVVSALDEINSKLGEETAALSKLESVMKRMQGQQSVEIEQYKKLQEAIDKKKASIEKLDSAYVQNMGQTQAKTQESVGAIGSLKEALDSIPAPAAKAAAVVMAIVAAVVAATIAISAFVLATADEHRSYVLTMEAAAGGAAAADELGEALDRVAATSAVSKDRLEEWAHTLAVAEISGSTFEAALKSLATVAAVVGPGAASKLEGIVQKAKALGHFDINPKMLKGLGVSFEDMAKAAGVSVDKLKADMKAGKVSVEQGVDMMAKTIDKRFGDIAGRQMVGLRISIEKFKDAIGDIFENVDVEPFLKGLRDLLHIFDANTNSGKAMAHMVISVFSAIFAFVAKAFPIVRSFFEGMIIGVLILYIALLKVWRVLQQAFGSDTADGIDWVNVAMYLGVGLVGALTAAVVLLTLMFLTMAAATAPIWLPILLMVALVMAAIIGLVMLAAKVGEAFADIDLETDGRNIVNGLVNGIKEGAAALWDTISGLVSGIKEKFTAGLGIHSPSRVFAEFGGYTAEGYAQGVDENQHVAQAAVDGMVEVPAGSTGTARAGRSRTVIQKLADEINIVGADVDDVFEQLEERIMELLDRADLAGPEPT